MFEIWDVCVVCVVLYCSAHSDALCEPGLSYLSADIVFMAVIISVFALAEKIDPIK